MFVRPESTNYFDLEDFADLTRLDEPMHGLASLHGLVVIDEVQRRPELYPTLRVLADRDPLPARFLVLGSAAGPWLRQSSESLAGRMQTIGVSGFTLAEIGVDNFEKHWLRGGFPLSFLAADDETSVTWREAFVQTLLERDLPMLGLIAQPGVLRRFWMMLAHYHGQTWNAAEVARATGLRQSDVRKYLEALEGVFMLRQLQPWFENLGKRQVKAPKIYFRDTGILHRLLGVRNQRDLLTHPRAGASWEGYVIEEVLRMMQPDAAHFWSTHNGAELDLLMHVGSTRVGVECKWQDAPRVTASMHIALHDLKLDKLWVVYPGAKRFMLDERIEALPLVQLAGMMG